MNVVVFSDSHGRPSRIDAMMARVLACGKAPDHVLCLGDGLFDLARARGLEGQSVIAVRGNGDALFSDVPEVRIIGLGKYRALMMHGHTEGVKYGLARAISFAVEAGVDMLLFGHTHRPHAELLLAGRDYMGVTPAKDLYVFNPGALKDGAFGHIAITEKGILMSHGDLLA